jgi:hypothetical protein
MTSQNDDVEISRRHQSASARAGRRASNAEIHSRCLAE